MEEGASVRRPSPVSPSHRRTPAPSTSAKTRMVLLLISRSSSKFVPVSPPRCLFSHSARLPSARRPMTEMRARCHGSFLLQPSSRRTRRSVRLTGKKPSITSCPECEQLETFAVRPSCLLLRQPSIPFRGGRTVSSTVALATSAVRGPVFGVQTRSREHELLTEL